jgi:hypothetical protein
MHVHGNQMNLSAINPYSAAAEKAAAAQRAADARKKLMKGAADIEGTTNTGKSGADETFMVERWMGSPQGHAHDDVEYHTSVAGKDSDFG